MPGTAMLRIRTPARAGFTLVEISIVLAIIGLVVGGIMVGADLIRAATFRAQGRQITEIQMAMHAFRMKYRYLPGDFSQAFGIWGTECGAAPAECNGDANGRIAETITWPQEARSWWRHLELAEIYRLPESPASAEIALRQSKVSPTAVMFISLAGRYPSSVPIEYRNRNAVTFMDSTQLGGSWTYGVLAAEAAEELDRKIDDGLASRGRFTAFNGTDGECVAVDGNYDLAVADVRGCRILYWLD
jgi:prepilin-type N-terminal cleavage/methylation domain-containing protein